jgi:hypothetical protein
MTETRKARKWHLYPAAAGVSLCGRWDRPDELFPTGPGEFTFDRPRKFECRPCHVVHRAAVLAARRAEGGAA